ncbi:Nucleolar Complex 2 protein, partial [Coemansia nantahalensis]
MGKVKKATRKFNQKHLKGELERRHKNKKAQQLHKKRELKKSRRGGGAGDDDSSEEPSTGINEVDGLAEFAGSSVKGVDENLSRFMEAGADDGGNSSDDEDIAALLQGDDDDDDDDDVGFGSDDDSDGSADEDEGSADEDGGAGSDDEEGVFKKQLEAMKEKDPAFFEFMKKNDPGALKILEENSDSDEAQSDAEMDDAEEGSDGDSAEGAEEGSDGDSEEGAAAGTAAKKAGPAGTEVTAEMLGAWEREIESSNSIRALKKLLLALYAASHMESENDGPGSTPFRIQGMRIFNKTVSTAIRVAPKALGHYAPIANGKIGKKTKKWAVVQALIKSYLASLIELVRQMSDAAMIQHLLKECDRVVPYFAAFARFTRDLVKELLRQFGSAAADDGVRIIALLTLKNLLAISPANVVDMALKGMYLTY